MIYYGELQDWQVLPYTIQVKVTRICRL